MKSFKDYLNNLKKKFVALYFTSESEKKLREYAKSNGFNITTNYEGQPIKESDFDFHLTIFFTTSYHDMRNGEYEVDPFEVVMDHFEMLGPDENIPVIKVDPAGPMSIRKHFESIGMEDAWPEYKPHISLSYNWDGIPNINNLKLPNFKVMAKKVVIKDQT